jgi:hypothetical protein
MKSPYWPLNIQPSVSTQPNVNTAAPKTLVAVQALVAHRRHFSDWDPPIGPMRSARRINLN